MKTFIFAVTLVVSSLLASSLVVAGTNIYINGAGGVFGYESNGWIKDQDSQLIGYLENDLIKLIGTNKPFLVINADGLYVANPDGTPLNQVGTVVTDVNVYMDPKDLVFAYEKDGWVRDIDSSMIGFKAKSLVKSKYTQKPIMCIGPDGDIHDYINRSTVGPVIGHTK